MTWKDGIGQIEVNTIYGREGLVNEFGFEQDKQVLVYKCTRQIM